uniref:Uncharacterized protein n=1 Tax=Physcomitrium patens TaxID=3218 RepID=A0A2K1KWC1_PHYPA|nr:hypothetical protein PHYPA_005063 [Physcomitrium patens]
MKCCRGGGRRSHLASCSLAQLDLRGKGSILTLSHHSMAARPSSHQHHQSHWVSRKRRWRTSSIHRRYRTGERAEVAVPAAPLGSKALPRMDASVRACVRLLDYEPFWLQSARLGFPFPVSSLSWIPAPSLQRSLINAKI